MASTMFDGPGFLFGKNDLIQCSNLTVFNLGLAFKFINDSGPTWGTFTDCSVDFCSDGWHINDSGHNITITGGTNWCHWYAMVIDAADSRIQIANMQMKTNGGSSIKVENVGQANINSCNIGRGFNATNAHMIELNGGESINLSHCIFDNQSPVIYVGSETEQVLISGNIFQTSGYNKLDLNLGVQTDFLEFGNLGLN